MKIRDVSVAVGADMRNGLIVAALLLSACGGEERAALEPAKAPTVEWSLKSPAISQAQAQRALDVFLAACPQLAAGMGDIEEIAVKTDQEYAEHRLAKGWKTGFEISIALKDDLKSLPAFVGDGEALSGQTLPFNLGGGEQAGVMSGKRAAQAICGLPDGSGTDTYRPLPQLSFLADEGAGAE